MNQSGSPAATSQSPKAAPGPRGKPFVGVLPEIRKDPLAFLTDTSRTYGDVAHYRLMGNDNYLISNPDGVKRVLQENNRNYSKQSYSYQMLKPLGGEGLLTSEGDVWLQQRRLMQPVFHKERIQAFSRLMFEKTRGMIERLDCLAEHKEPFNVAAEMTRLTLSIVGDALFGRDLGHDAYRIGQAFTEVSEEISNAFRSFNLSRGVPTPRTKTFKGALDTLNDVTLRVIRDHTTGRINSDDGSSEGQQADLLDILVQARDEETGQGMSEQQLRDQVITLMLAGHETTANALSWTWYLLAQNPGVEKRLKTELDHDLREDQPGGNGSPRFEYTRKVIQEALRLYPPVFIIPRRAEGDDVIGGYQIKKGSNVLLSPYVTHRHPSFWKDPDSFYPDRFSPGESENRPNYAYFPFGGGPRLCIGRDFAMMEAQIILANLAKHFHLELAPGHTVEPEPLITLRPKDGIWVIAHKYES